MEDTTITVNVQILNANGEELLDKRYKFESLDVLGLASEFGWSISQSAKANEEIDGSALSMEKSLTEKTEEELQFGQKMSGENTNVEPI